MKSDAPKVLMDFCGEPLGLVPLRHLATVVDHCVVVVGHQGGRVKDELSARIAQVLGEDVLGSKIHFVTQDPPQGTGDAVRVALDFIDNKNWEAEGVVVANGDLPLVTAACFTELMETSLARNLSAACLSFQSQDPAELGRIVRSETGTLAAIREFADCDAEEKKITEVNSGLYYFRQSYLKEAAARLTSDNQQGEFYLTDLLQADAAQGIVAEALIYKNAAELSGVNTCYELSEALERAQKLLRKKWSEEQGVHFIAPATTYISVDTTFGKSVVVGPNTVFKGKTSVAAHVNIHGNSYFEDCQLEEGATVKWSCVCVESVVGKNSQLGPMAHLRPQSTLGEGVKVGNFVELKKTTLNKGAKVSHLSYLGDSVVGEDSNIGCGTITCNYDGFNKYQTIIGKKAFIGSDTQLIAPVEVGDNAYVGSGTTVTKDVPAGALALARSPLEIKKNYAQKLAAIKAKKKAKAEET